MSGIPAWAVPGAKCVCVKRDEWIAYAWVDRGEYAKPSFGDVCTIEATRMFPEGAYARLSEYPIGCYNLAHFRPVVPPKSLEEDSTMFRKLLQPERADA